MRILTLLLLVASHPAFGAFTFLSSNSAVAYTSEPTISVTLNTSLADLIVVIVSLDTGGTVTSITDSGHVNAGCFVLAKVQTAASSRILTYYCVNPTSAGTGHTITVGGSVLYPTMFVAAYSGSKLANPIELISGASVTGTTIQPGSVSPGCTNELLVTGLTGDSYIVVSGVAGATMRQAKNGGPGQYHGGGYADSIQTSPTPVNPTWSISGGSQAMASTSMSFLAADSVCGVATAKHRIINQ